MKIWLIQDGEPIPGVDGDTREWRSAMLANALVSVGHEVLWWASTFDHANKRFRTNNSCTINLQAGFKLRLLHGPGYSRNKSPLRFYHHHILANQFYRDATNLHKPDLIFCSLPTLEFVHKSVNYSRRNSVPIIVDVRDLWPDLYLTMFPSILRRFARIILGYEFSRTKRSLKFANGITAVSESYLSWAIKMAGRFRGVGDAVYPLGYKVPSIADKGLESRKSDLIKDFGIQIGKCIICFAGSFGASYDLSTVLEAVKLLLRAGKVKEIQIVLAGGGDEDARLRKIADGIPNIIFTGWIDQTSLAALLQLSSVGLAAYKVGALQSLPNKPFEYMAAGLPLLSSLRGELEDLIKREQIGVQYQAGDADSLVKQIVWLAEHPEERQAIGRRARQLFEERYNADVIYPKFVDHIENVVRGFNRDQMANDRPG